MSLKQWGDFEASQMLAARQAALADADTLPCPNCGCTWFETIKYQQFKANHQIIHTQEVPPKYGGPFIFLRCANCFELTQPNLIRMAKDNMDKMYDGLLDVLEKTKFPDALVEKYLAAKEKKENPPPADAITAEKV